MKRATKKPRRDYKWLLRSRGQIQDELLGLYELVTSTAGRRRFSHHPNERRAFGLLVGAAFSLWRAAFLAHGKPTWRGNLKHAKEFLEILIGDNSINYPQDLRTLNWTSGYYLNSARFRLGTAYSLLRTGEAPSELTRIEFGGRGYQTRQKTWTSLHRWLAALRETLDAGVGSAPSPRRRR